MWQSVITTSICENLRHLRPSPRWISVPGTFSESLGSSLTKKLFQQFAKHFLLPFGPAQQTPANVLNVLPYRKARAPLEPWQTAIRMRVLEQRRERA
jgi:hypothetical protein